jgi:hypothetical protein
MSNWSSDDGTSSGGSGSSGSSNDYLSNTTGSNSAFRKVRRQHKALMQQNDGTSGNGSGGSSSGSGMMSGTSMKMPGTINNTKASTPEVTTGMKKFGAPKLNPLKRKMFKR